MGLNHIYKVIWSKTKNAWVVVSEIAKRDGKSSVKSVVTSLAGKSVAAVMVAMVMCGGVASANTAYGTGAAATGSNSTAIGDNASATGSGGVAMGNSSQTDQGVSIGNSTRAYLASVAIGPNATSSQYGVSIGELADTNTPGTSGSNAIRGVAIGYKAKSQADGSISIGAEAVADGGASIAIGQNAHTADYESIAIGHAVTTTNHYALAIGHGVNNYAEHSVALGDVVESRGDYGTVVGVSSRVGTASKSTAVGYKNSVFGGSESSTFGSNNQLLGTYSTIIGANNNSSSSVQRADQSGILGYNNNFNHTVEDSYIIGNNNIVNARRVMILGNNISVDNDMENAVVLGDRSNATPYSQASDVTVGGVTLESMRFAGNVALSKGSILSIGSNATGQRQIKNVAAGVISATSTDAINGSQLYEAVRAVTAGASPDMYMHVNDGTSTQGAGNASTNLGKANEKGGATGMYSIAIGQNTKASGTNSIVVGPGANSVSDNVVVVGSNPTGAKSIGNNSAGAVLVGQNSYIADDSGASSVLGTGISLKGNSSVAIGSNSAVYGSGTVAINGMAGRANGIAQFKSDSSVAINGGVKGSGNIAIGGVVGFSRAENYYNVVSPSGFTKTSQNSVAVGNNTLVTQSNTVMVGSYDKLYDAKANPDKSKVITPAEHTLYYTLGGVDKQYYEGTLSNSVYLGHESYAFTPDALVDDESHLTGEQSIHTKKYDATGNVVVSNNTTGGAFGKVSKATINGDEITGFAGAQSVGAVTIGAGDYERRIQNVAAGEVSATSTDGINGSQLYAVADTLSKNMSSYMHINDGTSTQTVGNATTNYGYSGSKAGATGNLAIAGGMNAKASGQQSLSLGSYTKSEGDYSVVIGSSHDTSWSTYGRGQTFALGNYSVVLGRGAQTNKDNSIAIGHRTEVKGEDSIGIGKYVFTGGYSPVSTESSSGITAVGTKLGVDGINTNVFGQGKIDNIGGGSPIRANDSTILGNRNQLASLDSNGQQILPSSINDYATGSHILGNDNQAWGNNAIAIGNKIFVYQNSVALGYAARAFGNKSIALGYGATANGENSISIGTGNDVEGAKSSAIGDPSYIDTTATGTHVHGNDNGTATNPIKASESTFMGNTNLAGTAGTTGIHVVGNGNSVDSSNVMVMGNNVTVGTGLDGAVVLGHASSADQYAAATDSTINGVTFEAAGYAGNTGLNNGSIVSVGATGTERQIKNVAAGAVTATSTDAINGSQLYKTAETILKMPINMAGDSGDTVGLKLGKTVNIKGSVASGADVTDGNIAVVGDKATSTLSLKMAKNLTGLTSGTFTDATGNQTVINGAGVTVTPTGTGTTPISITTSGINAGNQEIKGVKKGTTDDAAVNKKQMDDALAGISSTLTINDGTTDGSVNIKTGKLKVVGESGANALVTTTVSGDTITVGTSTKLQNAVTAAENSADKDLSNLSTTGSDKVKTLAQDAVKVAGTGLATVSDATAAGVKTYTVNVDEGKLVIDDTTGKIGAAGASQGTVQGKDGVATTQNVASVVNSAIDKTTKALTDAKHNFAGDDATVISRKHGEQLNIKGGASTTATDLTSGNIAVVGDTTSGTLNIKMAKALTGLTSATYTDGSGNTQTVTGGSSTISDAAGNSTVVSKGGVTTTDAAGNTTTTAPTGVTVTPTGAGAIPISVTTSGISAGNKEIKNVANGTTDDAAVNKKQMDDALKGATDNTVSLGSESGTTTAKKLSTTGGIKFNIKGETGANALITTSASGDDVTIAPTAKLTAAVTAAEKSADKDLSNLSAAGDTYIKNLAKSAASWNVETNGAGTTAVAGGDTVNFIDGDNIAITNTGRSITIGTAKNVSFDKVTVGGIVLDKNTGINAGNKEIKGIANGTTADAAVNKGQMDAAITAAASGSLSTEKVVAKTLTGDNNLATVTGQTGTAKGETYEVSVSENAVKAVAATAAQDAVKVAGTGLATVSDATAAGVKTYTVNVDEGKLVIDDTTGKIGAAGASQGTVQGKDGVATTQNVASVVNSAIDKTKQALDDAKHNFAGDDATVISRKHGEQLNIKGGASTTATDLTSGNIAVVGDTTSGTLNIKLAKVLTGLTSATYTDAAGNTQTVTGSSSTISDAAGNSTVVSKGGVTTTDGTNTTTVAPAGVTATDGTNTVKLTGSGIDAGNTQIKNVGKATTDDAAVNKKQMDDALKGATDNTVSLGSESGSTTAKKLSTTGGIKFNIKGETGANALISTSATGDDVTIAPTAKLTAAVTAAEKSADKDLSNISPAGETVIKNLAATSAQDAVKVTGTGLATVSDSTTGGVKTYNVDVKTGNLVVTAAGQAGATGTTGAGGAAGADGVATTQNVASAINDAITKSKTDTAQAIADAEHKFDGDTGTTSVRKHGEVLSIKGGVTAPADLTTGNIGVVSDGAGTLNIRLAKVLSGLTSATYTDGAGNTQTVTGGSSTISDAAGNSTVVSKGGVTTTDGTNTTTVAPSGVTATDGTNTVKLNGSGIDAGNTQIKNVGKATTDDAAVNKKQMDDAVKAATDSISTLGDNKVSLGSDSGTTTAKKLSTTGGIKFNIKGDTGANALISTSATGDDVTIAPTAKLTAAVTAAEKSADKDLSNLSAAGDTYIKNLAKTAASWNVETNGAGTTAVAGGDTVNFINGDNIAITNTGRSITIGTSRDVSFDKVTVGGIVLDKNTGINAGGKEIKGVANATSADAAVNKGQLDAAVLSAAGGALSIEKVEAGSVANGKLAAGDNNLASVSGLTGTAKNETYTVTVSENAVKAVAQTAAQDAVKVAGTGLATVSDATAAGVKTYTVNVDEGKLVIDDTTGKIGANGATQGTVQGKNGVATTQDVASVVNSAIDKTKQALTDAKHNFAGDDATVISRKHGEQLNIKGGASTTATDLTSGNIAVVGDTTTGTLNIKLAKALTGLTSATYTDAAGNTQTVTGGSSTITDGAGNTTTITKGGMTTTDGTNTTTVAPAGVTATDGTNTVKLNGSGIDAGNTQIKNVGKATTDDAAVNKKQMDDAVKAATDSISTLGDNKVSLGSDSGTTTAKKLSTTGGIKFNIKGETGANALITTSATGDDVTIAPTAKLTAAVTAAEKSADKDLSNISPAGETVIKNLAATSAQDAVKVTGTGLATVSDSTTGGVKTYNVDVKTGNLVVTAAGQAGATGTTGAGGAAGADGVATTQNVASAINDAITKSKTDTAQAIADAEHKFDGDTGTTSVRKHGEVLSVKGGVTATTDLTTGNIGVVSDGAGTLNIRLAKVLSGLTSATYTDAAGNTQTVTGGSSTITDGAGNTTTITKGGMTTTDGTNTTTVAPAGVTATDGTNTVKLNGSGIDAGNTQIKNVGKATTDDAAVNKKQMDDAVKAATDSISTLGDNKVSLGSDSGTTTAKKLSTTGGIKFNIKGDTGANALITTSATGDDVTIAPTAKLSAAVTAAENSANKDLSNLSAAGDTYIKNLAKTAASWNVETNGAGTTAVAGGDTVNFINGDNIAITNAGRSITIGTARNVSFDKVTVGGVVIDKNNGIDAGGKEITNVGPATSGNSAVNKTQMDTAIANAQTAATSTEKVVAKTLTGDTNLVTVTGQTGTAKGETYEVAVSENAVKAVAQTAAQDAVKVTGTGLANVTDSTTGGVKTYNVDVKTGNLVVTAAGQVGANGTTGAGGAAGADGVATTQNVASAINDAITKSKTDTAQAIADAEHKFDGDTGTTSVRKHGEVLSVKGGVTATTDLTTGNIGVVSDGAGTLNIRLAKTLTGLTSAAFTDGTHTVTIAGSGIDAGNTEIKHVGKATTDDAAVNKKQMDDAVKAATDSVTTLGDNKVSLGSDSGTTTAKKLSTTGGIKFNIKGDTGANALITTSATGDDVTIAPTAKLSAAVTAAENSANKDLSNLSTAGNTYIQNLAKSAASWNVETNGAGTTAVAGGDTVNFINGDNIAITNTGRSITIGTAKNVSFDKVTVGGVVIDKNNGIDAGGKEITNVGPATSGNSAVNKTQMDTAITNAVNKATTDAKHDFGGDDTTVVTRKHGEKLNIKGGASTTAADLTSGNIAVLGDATTGTLNIRMAKALTGLSSATFTTPSGTTVINGGGMTITPSTTGAAPISITTGGINAGNTEIKNVAAGTTPNSAVNKQQMDNAISNATANVGFSTAGNTGTGSVTNGQTLTITGTNGIETNASGQSITVGLDAATRAQINNATTTANNAAKKDLSNIDNAGKQVIKNTAAWNVKVNGAAAETVKGGDTVTFNDGDNIKVTNTGKDITIATKKDVSFDKVTVGNVVIDKNTNRISGLANAANNDEAVNLGQMNAAISTATAGTGTIKYKANGGTQNSVALTTGFDFKGDSNIQITADPANSGVINYKLNPALTGITSISGGTGAPTITLNAGSGSTPGNVSINSNLDMGGKQINNIGAATHAGDAVNKAQMDQALQNIAGASSNVAKSYAYKAGAGAAALAALKPIQYDPLEPTQIMAGIGNYKSQTAVALGVAHYTNENTMFNLGVSLDSHDGIVNAGVTHKFGYSPEKKAIPDKYKGGPISSIYVMQDEVTALQAIVQKQAAENEALRQQNEDMQRKVDMILSKIH